MISSLIGGLGKFAIFTIFTPIILWIATKFSYLCTAFPDFRIATLTISVVVFVAIIAIKRGVWH